MNHTQIKNTNDLRKHLIYAIEEGNYTNLEVLFNAYDSHIGVFILLELILLRKLLRNRKIYHLVSYRALVEINDLIDDKMINQKLGFI
uniref:Uncharacterized protein n=1 Tax=Pithovirus LCPAC202 TaxID=2506592 RepID=A0A481Z731_9VIRU|nr:MAG: hypothetical protein LCPAC202_03090 [Pithovirus LCPAC202]